VSARRPGSRGDLAGRTRDDLRRYEGRAPSSFWRGLGLIGSVGWPIALGAVGGALLGRALDRRFQTGVRFTLILLTIGTALSTYAALRAIKRHGR